MEPGVRRRARRRAGATRRSRPRSSARSRSWPRAGSTSRASRSCTRSTSGRATRGCCSTTRRALTRRDSLTGDWYDCSAHMLWIGERTRQPDGAHVEFFSGVHNPLGVQARADGDGRGDGRALRAAEPGAHPRPADADRAAWAPSASRSCCRRSCARCARPSTRSSGPATRCTRTSSRPPAARKTRHFDAIMAEIEGFFAACRAEGAWPGGVHLEFTGEDVTECLGGSEALARGAARRTATRRSATRA